MVSDVSLCAELFQVRRGRSRDDKLPWHRSREHSLSQPTEFNIWRMLNEKADCMEQAQYQATQSPNKVSFFYNSFNE